MKKKFLTFILAVAAVVSCAFGFSACTEEHTHSYTQEITTEATCTEKGVKTYTCSCNDTYTEEIPALGHDEKTHQAQEATCTEIGWEEYVTCEREGCDYSTFVEIPATGVHTWDNGEVTTEPTCAEAGVKTFTCTVCETATKTEPIDKIPHEYAKQWTSNATYHWHECECGDKKDEAKHTAGAPATATTPQTCTICGYVLQEETGILFNTLTVDGTKVYGKVSNTTTEFSFINEVTVKGNATYIVDNNKDCGSPIYSKTVDLVIGDNTFYVLEMIGNNVKLYTVTIRRRPMYEVSFNANGGTSVQKQVIEEDFFATEPETTRTGYTFTGWDYDFTQPITENTKITASWSANTDTKYTVNYYLQNLDDDNYTLHESVELKGETDTTAMADIKEYEHFTFYQGYYYNKVSGNINPDGGQVLSVYYTRNTYTLSINNSDAGTITNSGTYKYGKEITSTATPYLLGYEFIGWYSGEELLSTDATYTFTIDKNVTAKFAVKAEMSNFNFTSTATACSITGLKDKTITEIVVPDYVTSISQGAFSGCSLLESITIPFVGDSRKTASDTYQYPFGYIFDTGSYTGGTATEQYYYGSSTSSTTSTTYYIPTSLKMVTLTGGDILHGAFYNCYNLTSVVIGDSVTSIGNEAFYYCSSLTSVVIGDSVTTIGERAFYNCRSLTSVEIPDSVTSIGERAFYDCYNLTGIEIPDSVTSIGNEAFGYCESLTSVVIGDSVTTIGELAFRDCESLTSVVIGDSVTTIGYSAFAYCESLTSVVIPDSVTSISHSAFRSCSSLTSVEIGDSVTSIGNEAFYYCSSLTSVEIGDSVTSIGWDAFYNCRSLTSVEIGDSVTSIGSSAFYNCSSLTSVYITDIAAWCNISFSNYSANPLYYAGNLYLNNELVTELEIGDSVTSIGSAAFYDCESLTSVVIGDSVTSIGDEAFAYCDNLTSVVIGDSVTSIGDEAFAYCDNLTSVVIGDSVTSIVDEAFLCCYKLVEVVNKSTHITVTKGYSSNGYVGNYALAVYNSGDAFTSKLSNDNGYIVYTDGNEKILVGYNGTETDLVLPSYITKINQFAFRNCERLTSVVIPDSVTSIGDYAFYYCSSLTSVVIGDSVTSIGNSAFYNCSSLTSVVIGDGVTSIGEDAFCDCDSLTSVYITDLTAWCYISFGSDDANPLLYANNLYLNNELVTELIIPDSVTSIGSYAFRNCNSLTSVVIGDSVTSIGNYAFYGCNGLTSVVIGDSVTSIGGYAFRNCSSLTSMVIGDSVTSIGVCAFEYCRSLTSVVIGDSVTSIGDSAFEDCSGLTSVVIPDSVTSIGGYAFYGCSGLTNVVIGGSVTSIGSNAFYGCSNLQYNEKNGLKYLGNGNNPYLYLEGVEDKTITTATIENNCKFIGSYAFSDCSSLTSVVLADGVTSIGDDAFYGCRGLKSVVIPDSLTSIGSSAFYYCDSLTSVVIGDSVTSIGNGAFADCSRLTSVVIPDSVTSIGYDAFYHCYSLTIYCEAASKPSGWASSWNYSNRPVIWGYKG